MWWIVGNYIFVFYSCIKNAFWIYANSEQIPTAFSSSERIPFYVAYE